MGQVTGVEAIVRVDVKIRGFEVESTHRTRRFVPTIQNVLQTLGEFDQFSSSGRPAFSS
jgi:hypothetical protein